jgi:hypothetical protein
MGRGLGLGRAYQRQRIAGRVQDGFSNQNAGNNAKQQISDK